MGLSELEECSLSLDVKLLRFMEQLESLEEKQAALNSLIEQGWFSTSKARYSMGNKQVSALQYASEIEPLVCVHTRTLDNGEVEFCTERVTQSTESGTNVKSIEEIGPQEEGVRRRNKPKNVVAEKKGNDEASSQTAPEVTPVKRSEPNPQQDPLRWFGILVPQSLKQAQSSFKQVIELSAEIATLQTAVLNSREELKSCMRDKHILQKKTSAAQVEQTVK
ncbi:coiled-coil domain-containing protein 115 [Platichthys flesus]|uniref:coiled-coil domain-containing protein 115 n=1 Tax=Platichthys flesus TaxID=8260 RepID=UPI001A844C62|nr:coiled-coil domain-containing protein 115 [Platichthys flesus]